MVGQSAQTQGMARDRKWCLRRAHGNVLVASLPALVRAKRRQCCRSELALPRESLTPPADDEYYWSYLEGMESSFVRACGSSRRRAHTESGGIRCAWCSEVETRERRYRRTAHVDGVDVVGAQNRFDGKWTTDGRRASHADRCRDAVPRDDRTGGAVRRYRAAREREPVAA